MPIMSKMRTQAKSFWIKVLLYTVAVSFVIGFGAFSYVARRTSVQSGDDYVAKVNNRVISRRDFSQASRNYVEKLRDMLGDQAEQYLQYINPQLQVLQQLIEENVLMEAAEASGIPVTDSELRAAIGQMGISAKSGTPDSCNAMA